MHVSCHDFDNRLRLSNFSYHSISCRYLLSLSQLHILSHDTYHLFDDILFSSVPNFWSRPANWVATSIDIPCLSSGSNPNFLVATIFLIPASISNCGLKMASRPHGCSFSDRFMSQLLKCSYDLNDWSRPPFGSSTYI